MKKGCLLYLLLFCFTYCLGSDSLSLELLAKANDTLKTLKSTYYTHQTMIDKEYGIYGVDCSSFIGYLLREKAPSSFAQLPIDPHHTRPRAQNFYDYFKKLTQNSSPYWVAVTTIDNVEAGDIIAWKYDVSLAKKDTGHVVLVAEKPIKEEDNLYRVLVIDASKGKHSRDTRVEGEDGIGRGEMWFHVDQKGALIGYFWSDKQKKESKSPLAVGRVIKSF